MSELAHTGRAAEMDVEVLHLGELRIRVHRSPDMPPDELEVYQGGRLLARLVNLGQDDATSRKR